MAEKIGETELTLWGKNYNVAIIKDKYRINGSLCIRLDEIGSNEPFGVLSVNLPELEEMLENENQFFAKSWSENEQMANQLRDGDLFKYTGKSFPLNMVEVEIWEIKQAS